jgi:hypothetical protein
MCFKLGHLRNILLQDAILIALGAEGARELLEMGSFWRWGESSPLAPLPITPVGRNEQETAKLG